MNTKAGGVYHKNNWSHYALRYRIGMYCYVSDFELVEWSVVFLFHWLLFHLVKCFPAVNNSMKKI